MKRSTSSALARERQIVLFLTHFYDTKMYLKNCLISDFDVFFPQLSKMMQVVFPKFSNFTFKNYKISYISKSPFLIFFFTI